MFALRGRVSHCLQVRDRATLYLNTLGGDGAVVETDKDVKEFLFGSLDIPLGNLETSLKHYVSLLHFFIFYFLFGAICAINIGN